MGAKQSLGGMGRYCEELCAPWQRIYAMDYKLVRSEVSSEKKVCNRDRGKERIFTELAASEHSTTHEGLRVETAQEGRRVSPSFGGPEASSQHPCKVTHNCL